MQLLEAAVRANDAQGVDKLLKTRQVAAELDWHQCGALLVVAAERGFDRIVTSLLEIEYPKLNITAVDHNGWTALHHAANAGNVEIVRALIGPFRRDNHNSCRRLTQKRRRAAMVKQLLRQTTAIPDSRTALHLAAGRGHAEIVELLLDCMDSSADLSDGTPFDRTPLAYAARNGHCKVVESLLHRGALEPTKARQVLFVAANSTNFDISCLLIEAYFKLRRGLLQWSDEMVYALRLALGIGNNQVALKLLALSQGRLCINHLDLVLAIRHCSTAVISRVLEDGFGSTPLSVACECRSQKVVDFLVSTMSFDELIKERSSPRFSVPSLLEKLVRQPLSLVLGRDVAGLVCEYQPKKSPDDYSSLFPPSFFLSDYALSLERMRARMRESMRESMSELAERMYESMRHSFGRWGCERHVRREEITQEE